MSSKVKSLVEHHTAMKIDGDSTSLVAVFLMATEELNNEVLREMEAKGYTVLNITGTSPFNDVIWFHKDSLRS